jgi:hypothetical protein
VMGAVAMIPMVTPAWAIGYFLAGAAISVIDTWESADDYSARGRMNVGLNYAGAVMGGAGKLLRSASAGIARGSGSAKAKAGEAGSETESVGFGMEVGAVAASGEGAYLSYNEEWGKTSSPRHPAGKAKPASWGCWRPGGYHGPYGCTPGTYKDPVVAGNCNAPSNAMKCLAWKINPPKLGPYMPRVYGPYRPKSACKSGIFCVGQNRKGYYPVSRAKPKPKYKHVPNQSGSWGWGGNDGLHHKHGGGGVAWF